MPPERRGAVFSSAWPAPTSLLSFGVFLSFTPEVAECTADGTGQALDGRDQGLPSTAVQVVHCTIPGCTIHLGSPATSSPADSLLTSMVSV